MNTSRCNIKSSGHEVFLIGNVNFNTDFILGSGEHPAGSRRVNINHCVQLQMDDVLNSGNILSSL